MRAPRGALLAALSLLLCAPSLHARVWSGTVNAPFSGPLGRFAYGPGGGSAEITLSADPLGTAKNVQLAWFSDATWRTAKGSLNCQSTPDGSLSVLQNTISSVTETATMPAANILWGFALQSQPSTFDPAGTPCPTLGADYTLTATQASGSQLSYEEQGLPAIYACFWVFMALTAGAHVYGHIIAPLPQGYPTGAKGMRPPLVTCLLAALTLHMASDTLHLIEWAYVDVTGAESGLFLAVAGGLLRLAALAAVWVMAAFIATGYGVTTRRVSLMENNNWRGALLLGALVVLGLAATLLYAGASRGGGNAAAAGGVGLTLVLFTLGYLAWFIRGTLATIAAEVSVPKKALLTAMLWTTVGTFMILPFAEFLSALEGRGAW